MVIDSYYSKTFISDSLSKTKLKEIKDFAILLNNHKNIVSLEINNNLSKYIDLSFFDFLKLMRVKYKGIISSNFDKQLYQDIYNLYQSKFEAIQKKICFEKVAFKGFELYKRDSKNNKKGELKRVLITKEKTKLCIVLSYLARYGNKNTVNYIINEINKPDLELSKQNLYYNILYYVNKFGFERLFRLSLQKRDRIFYHYSRKPITFIKLTFRGRSRLKENIISYNDNYNSKINAFINISWLKRGSKLAIPVKYSKHYHGLMKDYYKDNPDLEYRITFEKNRVKIILVKEDKRFIPENKTNYVGIDVNVKHNLFSLSNGRTFDYNRKLINNLSSELLRIDNLKSNKKYLIGKKKQRKLDSIKNKIRKYNEQVCSDVCKHLKSNNLDHIVMENLDNSFGKSYIIDKTNNDINFNRTVCSLNLSSLKDMMEHIAYNYDISISTVHPEYTSKMCPVCGCIDDGNRTSQEKFRCVECGHEDNADHNAAKNIENRVSSTVLRSNLLKQNKIGNGSYEPRILKREKVKEILLSFRQNLERDKDISRMNTFNYI